MQQGPLDLKDKNLDLVNLLPEWEYFYNHKRPHISLNGHTPWEKYEDLKHLIPMQGEVTGLYWDSKHELMPRNSKYHAWLKEHRDTCRWVGL